MPPHFCDVNLFMRMERYIFIRYHLAVMDRILAPLSPDLDCSRSPMLRAAVSAVILLLCIPAAPVAAQQSWHWPSAAAVGATPPASASQRAETAAAPGPALQLEWQAPVYLAWAVNPLDGPAEVRLSAPPSADYRAVPQLPLVQSLGARERRLLARVYPVSQRRTLDGLGLRLEVVPGDPQAQLQEARYQLPFRDVPIQVDQGYGGQYSHSDDPNWYAIDFALPAGTPVLAGRDGVVMEIQQGAEEAGPHGPDAGGGNLVRLLHADGSMAIYAHLAPAGVLVRPGQRVRSGERLGSAGSTGFSTAPHLHFAVQRNVGLRLISLPFRMSGPQGELRFPSPAP